MSRNAPSDSRSFPRTTLRQAALNWQAALGPHLDDLGRQTGAMQRQRKFSGASLLKMVVLTLMKAPNPLTADFVATAAQLGVQVTAEAVENRFTDRLVTFLRAALEHRLTPALMAAPSEIPLLERFRAVELTDSTTIRLPAELAAEFPGCGAKPAVARRP